jgi:methionine-gamma-lyase
MGITTSFVNPSDPEAFRRAISDRTRVIYVETLANPSLRLADIPALAEIARERQAVLVVDNTFTPMIMSPARLGADVVVHSLTKFINGASDLIAGVICGSRDLSYKLMDLHIGRVMLLGPTIDPRAAFDILQRLPHLAIRVRAHSERAQALAEHLYSLGAPVVYPGLPSHPQYDRITELMNPGYGYGGIFNLDCGSADRAERLLDFLQNEGRFGLIAVSLGYYDTLMSCSGSSTSSEIPPEDRATMGLSPGLIRISVGFTGQLEDQILALEAGVKKIGLV